MVSVNGTGSERMSHVVVRIPWIMRVLYHLSRPGDCLIFHNRTRHGAPGNSLKATRRRALATHWIGDDITYNDKPFETDPPYRVFTAAPWSAKAFRA